MWKLSRGLAIPFLEKFSRVSSSSEVAGSMAEEEVEEQQEVVEMPNNCYSGENGDEVDALLKLWDKLVDTADSMEVPD